MTLRIFNTLSGEKEIFEPVKPGHVGIYLCGPTVYKPAHIGHAVGPVIFDVIKRYLTYKGFNVTWVLNVTDVEDKLMQEAAAQGVPVMALARKLEQQYIDNMTALGVRNIDHMPRASEHIAEIIRYIESLINKDVAYASGGDVYFDVTRDADYGKLSHRKPEEQFEGTREGLVAGGKRNPGDFALWKAAKPDEPADVKYESPWGMGRPGWHIECSAMAMKLLGETFDLHGGGLDLKFPHHENEIAQSESATGKPFARFWLHHGLTRFNTKKISKSDASFAESMKKLQLSNLIAEHGPELLRFLIVQSHYRSPIDFSEETLGAARTGMKTFHRMLERIERVTGVDPYQIKSAIESMRPADPSEPLKRLFNEALALRVRFLESMDDDFNTAAAIAVLFDYASAINRFIEESKIETRTHDETRAAVEAAGGSFLSLSRVLGLFTQRPVTRKSADNELSSKLLDLLVDVRKLARDAKQFQLADQVRNELTRLGVTLEDGPNGTRWRIE